MVLSNLTVDRMWSILDEDWLRHLSNGEIHSSWVAMATRYTPFELGVYGTFILSFWVYWLPCLAFLMVDVFRPAFLYKYKLQPHVQPSSTLILKGIALVLFNQFFVSLPLGYWVGSYMWPTDTEAARLDLPSITEIVRDLTVFVLIEEVCFYYSHRLVHHPALYKHIHKIHHQFTAPIALAAQYAHPLEQVVSNVGPVLLGPFVMQSHILTFWIWATLALINTLNSHSGYDMPFHRGQAIFHDFHHEKFNYCYGVLGVLDWLHGTDSLFRKRYGLTDSFSIGGMMLKNVDYKTTLQKINEKRKKQ